MTRSGCDSPPPAEIPERLTDCSDTFRATMTLFSGFSVGASLTAVTVTRNDREKVRLSADVARSPSSPPSSTVTLMVTLPL